MLSAFHKLWSRQSSSWAITYCRSTRERRWTIQDLDNAVSWGHHVYVVHLHSFQLTMLSSVRWLRLKLLLMRTIVHACALALVSPLDPFAGVVAAVQCCRDIDGGWQYKGDKRKGVDVQNWQQAAPKHNAVWSYPSFKGCRNLFPMLQRLLQLSNKWPSTRKLDWWFSKHVGSCYQF